MRTKQQILDSTERNAKKATGPFDISLIHSLHTLEVFIDIRDIIELRLCQIIDRIAAISGKD